MNIPKKQSIPIVLIFALLLWGSSALVFSVSQKLIENELFRQYCSGIIIFCLFLCAICGINLFLKKNIKIATCSLIAVLLGIILAVIQANNLYNAKNNILNLEQGTYNFFVETDQKVGSYYNNCDATINTTNFISWKIKLQLDSDFEEVHAGDIIKANVKFSAPAETQEINYWQNGICGNARASNAEKISRNDIFGLIYKYRNHLIETIRNYDWTDENNRSDAEGLLSAIICGQRIDLNTGSLYNSFKSDGLAHLVAVSGAHLSLVSAILLALLKKLKLKRWLIIFIQSAFIFSYLICAAIPISALRAAFMAYIALFSFFSKRRPAPLNALGLCIIILICINPQTSVSVSFALSAGSTIGIIIFSRLFEYWITKPIKKCPELISSALSLTFSANLCSQPLSVAIFTQLSLIAPIANIICTPLFSILCGYGLVATIFASIFSKVLPLTTSVIMLIAYCLSQLMVWCVNILASIPYASIPATLNIFLAISITVIACIVIYYFWPTSNIQKNSSVKYFKKYVLLSMSTLILFVCIFLNVSNINSTELKAFDVGQGDSIFLKSCGKSFLIDTGNQDNLLKSRLAENGITHLDGVLITHPDDDHCGSLDVIEQLVTVSNVYIAKDLPTNNEDNCKKLMSQLNKIVNTKNIIKCSVGDKISFGEIELNVIWPDKYNDNGGNSDSLTVVCNVDIANDGEIEARALLCGDAEKDEIDTMFDKRRIPSIDIYKCGHHGSKNALSEKSCKKLSPKITLISVGEKNRYGHPNSKTLEQLNATGSKIYRTDQNGTITCKFNSTSIDVYTEK